MTSIKTITEKLNAWRRYREAVRELSRLNDRELSDIGIRRGDIEFIVRQSVAAAYLTDNAGVADSSQSMPPRISARRILPRRAFFCPPLPTARLRGAID